MPRLLPPALAVSAGVAGALLAVLVARQAQPDSVPTDQLAIALVVVTYSVVALRVLAARQGHRVGALMALGASAWGIGEGLLSLAIQGHVHDPGSVPGAGWYAVGGTAFRALGWLVLVIAVPLLFPDGRLPWRGARWPAWVVSGAIVVFTLGTVLAPTPLDRRLETMSSPTGLPDDLRVLADVVVLTGLVACVVALGVSVASLVHRWRTGDRLQRQQLSWLGLSFALPLLLLPFIGTSVARPWMFAVVTLPVPVALAVAILQRRLYDVQRAASRTATYVALTVALAALYALVVGGVGAVLDERGAVWLPWVATGLVALCFAPLHRALQLAVDRLTYGQWSQPREVLGAAARRLADATDVPLLLQGLVTDLSESLRLTSVEIRSANGALHAAHGPAVEPTGELALTAYGEPVGVLRWTSEHPLREGDRRLLDDLAHQLGAVVHGALLVENLRTAQHQLVLAREEERRRLRRDLHDGLGPSLASLTLRVDTLRNRWAALDDPDAELVALRSAIQVSIADVRRIVEDLRPAPLDELGLVGALQEIADSSAAEVGVDLLVEPLPPLTAAVEVAVFRVVQEALSNAVRHANAATVRVEVKASGGVLHVEVTDDGAGAARPRPGGVGLHSMRERAEELGGRLVVSGERGAGTVVRLQVPITAAAGA